jgi:excisionase family DNA binding protein
MTSAASASTITTATLTQPPYVCTVVCPEIKFIAAVILTNRKLYDTVDGYRKPYRINLEGTESAVMERVMPRKKREPVIPVSERALTTDDVAAALSVTRRAVQKWIHEGQLKAFRVGKEFRVDPSELEAFKRARQTVPESASTRTPAPPSWSSRRRDR